MTFFPEGKIILSERNKQITSSLSMLREAKLQDIILEGTAVLCDSQHNLTVKLSDKIKGFIPREEGALGIKEGTTRDIAILSRVNKPCCFTVIDVKNISGVDTPILSRKRAQQLCYDNYINNLRSGDIIDATVTHIEPFGAFVDIGCGISSLIPIDLISVSRISHPSDRFSIGQDIKAIVKDIENQRVFLSHKELLGTWQENASLFSPGETVGGIIRSVENYGVFVELTPNLAGLAESHDGSKVSQHASVYIKSIIPEKMKVKLIIIDSFDEERENCGINYFQSGNHIDKWHYSPPESDKLIETVF